MRINGSPQKLVDDYSMEWQPITTAPYGVDLELSVVDGDGIHALVFPCRRDIHGWINAKSKASVEVHPSHWREWDEAVNPLAVRPSP